MTMHDLGDLVFCKNEDFMRYDEFHTIWTDIIKGNIQILQDALMAEKISLEETIEDLSACLGQEDEKIQMLIGLLQQNGIDPSAQLAQVCLLTFHV